jgi:4-hydroxy-tetrahydrodipicolinate synthase
MKGSIVAIVTPMKSDGSVDFDSLKKLFLFHEEARTDGIVLIGTTGEAGTLSISEREKIFKFASDNTSIPLMAGVGSSSTSDSLKFIDLALNCGINKCLAVTPYYNKPSQHGLIAHYKKLASSGALIYLYNVPGRTGVDLQPESVNKLLDENNIVGIKEAINTTERMKKLSKLLKKRKDFYLLSGDDPTFAKFGKYGAVGIISVAANVVPEVIKQISDSIQEKNFEKANSISEKYEKLFNVLLVNSPGPSKYLLAKIKRVENNLRLPLVRISEKLEKEIDEIYSNT